MAGVGVARAPHAVPPLPDAFDGEGGGIMVRADMDPTHVLPQIIDPVGHILLLPKIVDSHLFRLSRCTENVDLGR